jgi:ceramide glucosyltransferase
MAGIGLAEAAGMLPLLSLAAQGAGTGAVRAFARRLETFSGTTAGCAGEAVLPPLSVLKPVAGLEPLLEEALTSFFRQDYPEYELLFGLTDPADPARTLIERLIGAHPHRPARLIIAPDPGWANRKIGNLSHLVPEARHELLVIADADIHAPPHYLRAIAAAHAEDGVGLVTTLYTGLAASDRLPARLGALHITHEFLPGALLGAALGREDGFGATLSLRRSLLEEIGGMAALGPEIADDAVLAKRVRAAGYRVTLAPVLPATTVAETTLGALWQHELRWARVQRSIAPISSAFALLHYPIPLALLALGLSAWSGALAPGAGLGFALAGLALLLAVRLVEAHLVARALAVASPGWNPLLFVLRELLSAGVLVASFLGRHALWRGERVVIGPAPAPRLRHLRMGKT